MKCKLTEEGHQRKRKGITKAVTHTKRVPKTLTESRREKRAAGHKTTEKKKGM